MKPFNDTIKDVIPIAILNDVEANRNHRVFNSESIENINYETSYTYINDLTKPVLDFHSIEEFADPYTEFYTNTVLNS